MEKLSPELVAELYSRGYENPGFFCRTVLPHWFSLPMPWVHRGILALLTKKVNWLLEFGEEHWPEGDCVWTERDLDKILRHFVWKPEGQDEVVPLFELTSSGILMRKPKNTLLIMPRGVSKTTIVNAANLHGICYKDDEFTVYISHAAPHAVQQLDNVKGELTGNTLLITLYGNKKPQRTDEERWNQYTAQTVDGVTLVARGAGSQIRGLNVGGKRPKKLVLDDVEDRDEVKLDTHRKNTLTWFTADVMPALPRIGKTGEMLVLGTVLHEESLLLTLAKNPEFAAVRFGALDPDGDPLWPHYMTSEGYEAEKLSYARVGMLPTFYMEYGSVIKKEGDNKTFDTSKVLYIVKEPGDFVGRSLACDPAISKKKKSDRCAFAVMGITKHGRYHLCEVLSERGMHPRDQVDTFFDLHFKWECTHHGIEAIAYQQALIDLVVGEMARKATLWGSRAFFSVEPITHGNTGKKSRIMGVLAPRYKAGYVTHQRHFPTLEAQMLDFSPDKDLDHDDDLDVTAMALALLSPLAPLEMDDMGAEKLLQNSFKPLELEIGEWRHAP